MWASLLANDQPTVVNIHTTCFNVTIFSTFPSSRSRVLQTLTVLQLVTKFRILCNPKVHDSVHYRPLSQINTGQALTPYHVKIHIDMYMSYGWGSTGENVTSERYTT